MPGNRTRGMDHTIYPYSPIGTRQAFRLPGNAKIAFFVTLYLEYFEVSPPETAYSDPRIKSEFPAFFPDLRTWSMREYGNRIGIYRIFELLARLSLPATVALNAMAAERYPNLVAQARNAGYEPVAHGISSNRMITSRMTADAERQEIIEARDRLTHIWGGEPRGWCGQDYGVTPRTSAILAELGFDYTLDWPNDEQPYWHNPARSLVAVPAQAEWDDVQTLWVRRVPVRKFPALVSDALDRLLIDATDSARVMGVGVHPWMLGAPHRIRYLTEALQSMSNRPGVLPATAGQIAGWFRQGESG